MLSAGTRLLLAETSRKGFLLSFALSSHGFSSDSQIASQMQVMNRAYANAGITWVLAGTTRTVNSDWFNNAGPGSSQQTAMKNALRVGDAKVLNVYTVGYVHRPFNTSSSDFITRLYRFRSGSGAGLLGYSTFPSSYGSAPKDDGVVMLFSSVPGGTTVPYNLGQVWFHIPCVLKL